jgi:hypothetical protein
MLALLTTLLVPTADADQRGFEVQEGRQEWTFDVKWTDADGERHRAQFALPADAIQADIDTPLRFQKKEAAQQAARAVRQYGETLPNATVKAKVSDSGRLAISVTARKRSRATEILARAEEIRDGAMDEYLDEHGYTRLDDAIVADHARHVTEYADDLAPLVAALGGPTDDPRKFASIALSYVQSIPYQSRAKVSNAYRRPLLVVARNKGDCDSKSTLFLALMRSAWPDLPLAVVYIPGHAFAGLGIEPQRGDITFRKEGQTWVVAEPVGPAMFSVGETTGKSRRRARLSRVDIKVAG